MKDYIYAVVSHYRNKIPWWDVVNGFIDNTQNNGRPFDMRGCFWFRKLGQDYVKYVFIFAHEGDPTTELYYNDYNIEGMNAKLDNALALLHLSNG
jgi:endo-1,4-beta-xylanase